MEPNRKRFFSRQFSALAVMVCMAGLLLPSCSEKKEEVVRDVVRSVKIMTIEGSEPVVNRTFTGKVRALHRVDLAFQVGGPLISLPVDEGMRVKKGQLIARILPRDFESTLAKARARALEAKQQYQRYRELYAKKQVSKADFDKYKSRYDIAKAHEKEARDALNDTYLRAPFAGVIAKRYVENYEEVKAKQPVVSIQDISQIEILIDVPEAVMATNKNGPVSTVAEFAAAPGKQYKLKLKEYSTEADPRTQTYQVTLMMPQPGGVNILPGMTATVRAVFKEKEMAENQIVVPALAVFSDDAGNSHVWTVNPGTMTVHKRKVVTGNLQGVDGIRIIEGLKPGEMVAITGVSRMSEGMKVRNLSDLEGYSR